IAHTRVAGIREDLCKSPLFRFVRDIRSPFASYSTLRDFFNAHQQKTLLERLHPQRESLGAPHPRCTEPFDDTYPLVLTHQNLVLRNVVRSTDGRLWVIGWGMAGIYPRWFEYIAMKQQASDWFIMRQTGRAGEPDEIRDGFMEVVCGGYEKYWK
ncbi:hypothetical protein DXG01_015497, partial [Tephrocybe rancida]